VQAGKGVYVSGASRCVSYTPCLCVVKNQQTDRGRGMTSDASYKNWPNMQPYGYSSRWTGSTKADYKQYANPDSFARSAEPVALVRGVRCLMRHRRLCDVGADISRMRSKTGMWTRMASGWTIEENVDVVAWHLKLSACTRSVLALNSTRGLRSQATQAQSVRCPLIRTSRAENCASR
jgi:hypothetical protein